MKMLRRHPMIMAIVAVFFVVPFLAIAQVAWVKDFGAALKKASKENKFLVLDVSASW